MPNPEYDLRYMQVGLEGLKDYLLSKDIYYPLTITTPAGERPYPPLTLGNLLLAHQRLKASAQTDSISERWYHVETELDRISHKWRVAWENKAAQEFGARLTLWRNYLEEYRQSPQEQSSRYRYEVERRVMLELLGQAAFKGLPDTQVEMLFGLDKLLRSILTPTEFIWDEELATVFPPERYWFLYGSLPENQF